MGLPSLPKDGLSREDAINLIISSIALEEIGLSHIINAEGEKLQYALGTLEGATALAEPITIDELLDLNRSIRTTLETTMKNQMLLGSKLQTALKTPNMQGPKGDTGDVGAILGAYNSFEELTVAHSTGSQGDAYLVGGDLYVWDTQLQAWKNVGNMTGPQGEQGATGARGLTGEQGERGERGEQGIQGVAGTVGTIKGAYNSLQELRDAHPDGGEPGDFYYINPDLYVWDEEQSDWLNVGRIAGPQGIQGLQGVQGERGEQGQKGDVGTILGSYPSYDALVAAHPVGNQGDAFLVGGNLYVWKEGATAWENVGDLTGPIGPQGPAGTLTPGQWLFLVAANSSNVAVGYGGTLQVVSDSLTVSLDTPASKLRIEKPYGIGTVIPFNSGDYATLTTGVVGQRYRRAIVGRGSTAVINSTNPEFSVAGVHDLSFPMPSKGTATALAVYATLTTNTGIIYEGAVTTVTAQLYVSRHPATNMFVPIDETSASFTVPFTHLIGTTYSAYATFEVPLEPQDRILLVLSSQTAPTYAATTTIGLRASASLEIR